MLFFLCHYWFVDKVFILYDRVCGNKRSYKWVILATYNKIMEEWQSIQLFNNLFIGYLPHIPSVPKSGLGGAQALGAGQTLRGGARRLFKRFSLKSVNLGVRRSNRSKSATRPTSGQCKKALKWSKLSVWITRFLSFS